MQTKTVWKQFDNQSSNNANENNAHRKIKK